MEQVANKVAAATTGRFAINVGPNKDRIEHAAEDSLRVIERFASHNPLYAVVNVSSPNTARLRELQGKDALFALLSAVKDGRSAKAARIPLLVKIAPDLTEPELDDILAVVTDLRLDGIVATNTSVSRPQGLGSPWQGETGGLSGRPIRERSTRMIARIHDVTAGSLTLIAAGGVVDGADALDKVGAGATIVQTYTGFIYGGPGMGKQVKQSMSRIMRTQGIASLDLIRGTGYRAPRS
jgi:dihydroorotate dehydrogenase